MRYDSPAKDVGPFWGCVDRNEDAGGAGIEGCGCFWANRLRHKIKGKKPAAKYRINISVIGQPMVHKGPSKSNLDHRWMFDF